MQSSRAAKSSIDNVGDFTFSKNQVCKILSQQIKPKKPAAEENTLVDSVSLCSRLNYSKLKRLRYYLFLGKTI
jgi:hypothetical protein